MLEAIAIGAPHVVHADRGNRFHTWIDFRCTDGKAAAAADPQHSNSITINKALGTQIVYSRTEVFGIDVWRHQVTGTALTFSPERQINGQGDETLLCQFLGVKI
ncbi:hypothetical protein D3C79_944330 [compost metagenome]